MVGIEFAHIKMDLLEIEDCGMGVPIRWAVEQQNDYWAERVYGKAPDRLIFVEHEPVYTAGASLAKNPAGIRQCFKKEIWELPATVEILGRGGLVTYQGRGILSVYCVFGMKNFSVPDFENTLLDSVSALLKTYSVETRRRKHNPGLYIGGEKKVVSFGLQISRAVSRYGITISLDPEQKYLEPLIPCGIKNMRMTSLAEELGVENFSASEKSEIKTKLASEILARWLN